MPAAGAIIAAAVASGVGAAIAGVALPTALLVAGAQLALGAIGALLTPRPRRPNFAPLEVRSAGRTISSRQPITPWRMMQGEGRISGPIAFMHASDDQKTLYVIVVLCSVLPSRKIGTVYLNDEAIFDDEVDADGEVTAGKFAGNVVIRKHLGEPDQAADGLFVSEVPDKWTPEHRLRGHTYVAVKLTANRDLFPNGLPNISAWVQGPAVFDPRDSGTRWTTNPALLLRNYLTDTAVGVEAPAAEIDDAFVIAAANVCDEFVPTRSDTCPAVTNEVSDVDADGDWLAIGGDFSAYQTGDRLEASTTDTLPAGLAAATPYYAIIAREVAPVRVQLAATFADALAGVAVDITGSGQGTHTLSKTGEPRYTASGVIDTDRTPREILLDLMSAMGGTLVAPGDKWRMRAAAYAAPTVTLSESDMRGATEVTTRHGSKDRFNAVKGIFVSPVNAGQPSDYPPVVSAGFAAEDGRTIFRDLDLSMTTRPQTAQRLAKIELLRHRQEITGRFQFNLSAFQLQAADTFGLTSAVHGWDAKAFEIVDTRLVPVGGGNDEPPALGVDLSVRETAAEVYDFDADLEETLVDPAVNTNLPDGLVVPAPGVPVITEDTYIARQGGGVKAKAIITWGESASGFLDRYEVEHRPVGGDWAVAVIPAPAQRHEVLDIVPGTYDFRVRAINSLGVRGPYAEITQEIQGLAFPPVAISGLTIERVGGLAVLRWDEHPDLDVRHGGRIVFRHTPNTASPTWAGSTSIGEAVPGTARHALLPLMAGTYLVKAVDSSGVASTTAATVKTAQAVALNFTNVDSLQADPTFLGTKTDTFVDGSVLKLTGATTIDSWGTIDSVAGIDEEGGVAAAGTYDFSAVIDRGAIKRVRITAHVRADVVNVHDTIDSRIASIDSWDSFDGDDSAAADCQIWVRHTDDDPAGSPTWSAYERLHSGEFEARAFDFQARLVSDDPAFNVHVTELRAAVDEIA